MTYPKNLIPTMKAAKDLTPADFVVVSDRLAAYHSKPELAGKALRVVSAVEVSASAWAVELDGIPATGIAPAQEVEVRVTVETPGVFSERARLVASVPKSAAFEFGYDGHSFFSVQGELVAVAR